MDIFKLKSTDFSLRDFASPTEEYAPVYGWFWNGPITDERTEEQILEMHRLGIRAFYIVCEPRDFRPNTIPTLTDPNYLTDAYFERYKFAMDKARELGMKCWLYDEGGWPSGGACGRVMLDHPEYARRTLDCRTVTLKGGEAYKKSSDSVFASFIDGAHRIYDGFISKTDIEVDEYYSKRIAFDTPGKPDLPDLTRADSTDYFIELTHEGYKKFIKEHLGSTVTAVFTDEPSCPAIPFRTELVEEYERKYGESVLPHLPAIFERVKTEGASLTAKIRWFDLVSHAFCDNFLLKCKKWANENGMAFTGHLDRDDEPRGSMFGRSFHVPRAMRCMDVPGIDVIWRQIFPNINGKTYENRFFPRYASSAAAQNGTDLAMTESFGVYGNGLTLDQMRYVVGFQAIRGVTLIDPMKISYERRGPWLAGELPSFEEDYPSYNYLADFNKYMERLSYVLTRGKRVTKTALYYPINNFWADVDVQKAANEFDALGFEMERLGVDFDIVDDDIIRATKTASQGVVAMGKAAYTEIVMPRSAIITDDVQNILDTFVSGGGKILYAPEDATPSVEFISGGGSIVASRRRVCDGEIVCLFNGGTEKACVTIKETPSKAYLIDITSGRLLNIENNGTVALTLESGETSAIYLTEAVLPTEKEMTASEETEISDFAIKRTNSFTFGEMFAKNESITEEAHSISLGDWSCAVGRDFSGTCAYVSSFEGVNGDIILDLGDVRHTCEVFLNGKALGVRIMKPYRYEIPAKMLRESNDLEIRVTNTAANQQHYSKAFETWAPWQLTVYNDRQNVFDEDSLDSGLFGPVKILFNK